MDEALEALKRPPFAVVLVAPPGAGKTTSVPLALLEQDCCGGLANGKILVTEPRRVAARAAAGRMSALRQQQMGGLVGYRTRYDRCVDPLRTRIEVVTDGILARQIQADPALHGVAAVLFDEFHERGLGSDLGLTLCLHTREARSQAGLPPLRLVAMSATLTPEIVSRLATLMSLNDAEAAVVASEGRSFKVDVQHWPKNVTRRLYLAARGMEKQSDFDKVVAKACIAALQEGTSKFGSTEQGGDVLCFLPGEKEIRRTGAELRSLLPDDKDLSKAKAKVKAKLKPGRGFGDPVAPAAPSGDLAVGLVDVVPLYGNLDPEQQDRAVQPGPAGRRRVILATNIAEASITVAGVTAVVDSGLQRRSRFSKSLGMDLLETAPISQASAEQRAGRAGRVRDGLCFRLWNPVEKLEPADAPEIQDVDLCGTVLMLADFKVPPNEISNMKWLDPPPRKSIGYAVSVLQMLGMLETDLPEGGESNDEEELPLPKRAAVTAHGRAVAQLPLHPRLGHMALRAASLPQLNTAGPWDVADLCALLEEENDVIRIEGGASAAPQCANVRLRLEAVCSAQLPSKSLKPVADRCARVRQNAAALRQLLPPKVRSARGCSVGSLLLEAYPERLARRVEAVGGGRFCLRDGTNVRVEDPSFFYEEFLAVARLRKNVVTLAAPLRPHEAASVVLR